MNGIGERAGNTCLEDFLRVIKYKFGRTMGIDTDRIGVLSEHVKHAVGRCFAAVAG